MSIYPNATEIQDFFPEDPTAHAYVLEQATPEVAKRILGHSSTSNLYLIHIDLNRSRIFLGWGANPMDALSHPVQDYIVRWRVDRGETGPETITIESLIAQVEAAR